MTALQNALSRNLIYIHTGAGASFQGVLAFCSISHTFGLKSVLFYFHFSFQGISFQQPSLFFNINGRNKYCLVLMYLLP